MSKKLVNKQFEHLVLPVVPFEVTDKLPQHLRVILSTQIRGIFALRSAYEGQMLQQSALDVLLDEWWKNHWTMIKAASKRPEWSWDDLALLHSKEVLVEPQFVKAERNLRYFVRGCTSRFNRTTCLTDIPNPGNENVYITELYTIVEEIYKEVIFEGLSPKSIKHTPYVTIDTVNKCKAYYSTYNPLMDVEISGRSMKWPKFKTIFKEGIGKLPEVLYKNPETFNDFILSLRNNREVFMAELYKYIGCCQVNKENKGVDKSTLVNKLLTLYFQFVLIKLKEAPLVSLCTDDGRYLRELDFQEAFDTFINGEYFRWVSNDDFKTRSDNAQGYTMVRTGTYNQMLTRILTEVSGCTVKESFIVSYHPCDLITCSLGYNWSSCQSFIDKLESFPANYGRAGNGTSSYSGCYHAGNFGFLAGNGYVAYIPYKEEYPLFLTAKLKRMLMWTSNSLCSMRQNFFYPGRPSDSDSNALASSIRAYLQNVYATVNGTRGTADWIAYNSTRVSFTYSNNIGRYFCGYNDPIHKISAVKNSTADLNIIYASKVPLLNTAFDMAADTYVGNYSYTSNDYNRYILATRDRCPDSPVVLKALNSKDEFEDTFNFNTITINDDLVVTLDWYLKYFKKLTFTNDKLLYNSKKYKTANGFRYALELPENVKACAHCGDLFTEDLLINGYCIFCAMHNSDLDIIKVRENFCEGKIALSFTEETLCMFFDLIPESLNIKWRSGKSLKDFIPQPKENVLVLDSSYVMLKSKARNTLPIYSLENYMKGGENNE